MTSDAQVRCSFCGKSGGEAKRLLTAASAAICDQCVARCSSVVAREEAREADPAGSGIAWYDETVTIEREATETRKR